MHPCIQHQLTRLRAADMHRQAQDYRIARDARRARANRQLAASPFRRPGTVLEHLLPAVLARYGQRLRPASAAPQLPSGSRR